MGASCTSTSGSEIGIAILDASDILSLVAVVTPSVSGTLGTISITVPTAYAGYWKYHVWLSDSNTDPTPSIYSPDDGNGNDWEGYTDSNGSATITFTHTTPARTWYAWITLQKLGKSSAIAIGS